MKGMRSSRKSRGYAGEQCAADWYVSLGYTVLARNYTIKGGELDIIVRNGASIVFVEVKVVDCLLDFTGILSFSKRRSLRRTISHYLLTYQPHLPWRLDLVLVKGDLVFQHYEALTV